MDLEKKHHQPWTLLESWQAQPKYYTQEIVKQTNYAHYFRTFQKNLGKKEKIL